MRALSELSDTERKQLCTATVTTLYSATTEERECEIDGIVTSVSLPEATCELDSRCRAAMSLEQARGRLASWQIGAFIVTSHLSDVHQACKREKCSQGVNRARGVIRNSCLHRPVHGRHGRHGRSKGECPGRRGVADCAGANAGAQRRAS